jgi:beta-glucanase (GH16 family)
MKNILFLCLLFSCFVAKAQTIDPYSADNSAPKQIQGMKLLWNDEFNTNGAPNPSNWKFEKGFVRNEELQWYQEANATCENGLLVFNALKANLPNPNYVAGSTNWKTSREYINYTSSSIQTAGLFSFLYGRVEVRARIDTSKGAWPAIWTLGENGEWPACGEIDMMEFYRIGDVQNILANMAWGTNKRWTAKWDGSHTPLSHFLAKDKDWPKKFHIWRMDWTKDKISLYLDDELLNETDVNATINPVGPPANGFQQKQYLLLNLAIGGNGGDPSKSAFPIKYEVDYVRVYQDI